MKNKGYLDYETWRQIRVSIGGLRVCRLFLKNASCAYYRGLARRGGSRWGGGGGLATHMQKGGHMIVLQNEKLSLSLTFTKGKKSVKMPQN